MTSCASPACTAAVCLPRCAPRDGLDGEASPRSRPPQPRPNPRPTPVCQVCNEDGSMSRIPELLPFCEQHGLVLTSIADLTQYIEEMEVAEVEVSATRMGVVA